MTKLSYPIIILTFMLMVLGFQTQSVQAATLLPASNWYAVTYVSSTDTLHWINAQGEQGQLDRPHLANEAANPAVLRMRISPNGQHMVLIASLNNGNLGVGFYDFVSGQFVQAHEAQPNEVLPSYSQLAFSFTGSHFAMALRNMATLEWRIIVFETATGNAVDQLTRTSPILPDTFITDPSFYPLISHFNVDEGIGQSFVGIQLVTDNPTMTSFPSFNWYHNPVPAVANAPVVPASLPYSPFAGHDIRRTSKAVVFTGFTEGQTPTSNAIGNNISTQLAINLLPTPLVNSGSTIFNSPQWLKNGEWIGYRIQDNVHQPHYAITSAQSDTSVPLGPNIGAIHSTPDGLVAVNALDWQLYHLTDTNIEAFAYQFSSTIFSSNGQPFSVIYTTPEGSPFTLTSIPTDAQVNVPLGGNGEVQAPEQTCGTAPTPRLTVGNTARVAFTDGTDLNIRTAPAGDYIMQIVEGTVVNVIGGPTCADNYFWWQIQFESQGVTVGGWAAEGTANDYFLEPYNITVIDPPQFVSSATPLDLIIATPQPTKELQIAVQPTNTPQLQIAVQPTSTKPPRAEVGDCSKAPDKQLAVGMSAKTTDLGGGTLAMRTNLSDPYPSNQVPANHPVQVVAGSQCREGFRMWQVSTQINGQNVVGWVAEGLNSKYYVIPQ
jgi:hypothetical protein